MKNAKAKGDAVLEEFETADLGEAIRAAGTAVVVRQQPTWANHHARAQIDPDDAIALAKIVRRAQRGMDRRRGAKAAAWSQQIADAHAMLDHVEVRAREHRTYLVGAARLVLDTMLLEAPRDEREARKKKSAIDLIERRFVVLSGECLACVAEERWHGGK